MNLPIEDVFNMILASTCPKYKLDDGTSVFFFDLCCKQIKVYAKCVQVIRDDSDDMTFKYEISNYEWV